MTATLMARIQGVRNSMIPNAGGAGKHLHAGRFAESDSPTGNDTELDIRAPAPRPALS